jgi:hypothetical protein
MERVSPRGREEPRKRGIWFRTGGGREEPGLEHEEEERNLV